MTTIRVDPLDYATASNEFGSLSRSALSGYHDARSSLRQYNAMAGDDPGGENFAREYDQGAKAILQAMRNLAVMTNQIDRGIMASGAIHHQAECLAAGKPVSGSFELRSEVHEYDISAPPSAFGGKPNSTPDLWEMLKDFVGTIWPNADTDKMRRATTTWHNIASDLESVARSIRIADNALLGNRSGEIRQITDQVNDLATDITELATNAREIGDACSEYADCVDEAHAEVMRMVAQLAVEIAAGVGLSVALSFVTFGGAGAAGAAAMAARIAAVAARIGGVLGKVLTMAANVALRFAALAARITMLAARFQKVFRIGIEVVAGAGSAMLADGLFHGKDANLLASGLAGAGGGLLTGGITAAFSTRTLSLLGKIGAEATAGAVGGGGSGAIDSLIRDGKLNLNSIVLGAAMGGVAGGIGGGFDGLKGGSSSGGGTSDVGGGSTSGRGPTVNPIDVPTIGGSTSSTGGATSSTRTPIVSRPDAPASGAGDGGNPVGARTTDTPTRIAGDDGPAIVVDSTPSRPIGDPTISPVDGEDLVPPGGGRPDGRNGPDSDDIAPPRTHESDVAPPRADESDFADDVDDIRAEGGSGNSTPEAAMDGDGVADSVGRDGDATDSPDPDARDADITPEPDSRSGGEAESPDLLSDGGTDTRTFASNDDAIQYGREHWNGVVLTPEQRGAVLDYTREYPDASGVTYQEINGALRQGSPPYPDSVAQHIREIDAALAARPLPEAVRVTRATGTGHWHFDPANAAGNGFTEASFLSTSLGSPALDRGDAILHLDVPEGTPALWVENVSAFGAGERELLLGRGLTWVATRSEQIGGKWHVYAEVRP